MATEIAFQLRKTTFLKRVVVAQQELEVDTSKILIVCKNDGHILYLSKYLPCESALAIQFTRKIRTRTRTRTMGGGASHGGYEEEDWDNVPINKGDLHTDGKQDHRHSRQALADQMSFTSDFGRLSPQSKLADNPYTTEEEGDALKVQAASHWHKIMSHARESREAALESGDEVPCPLCGQMTDDPQFCGFCGDIVEATQEHMRALEEQARLEETAADIVAAGGAPPSSPGSVGRLLGSFLNSTRNLLSGSPEKGAGGSGSDGGSPTSGNGSPGSKNSSFRSSPGSFRRTSNTTKHDGKGSSLIDLDVEQDDMKAMLGTLLEGSLASRNRGKGATGAGKSTNSIKAELRKIKIEESEQIKREQRQNQWKIEQERRNEVRRFVGMGLDSDSESDEDIDEETRILKKQLRDMIAAEKAAKNRSFGSHTSDSDVDEENDNSDIEGATAWERSPFFRLLNANTINAAKKNSSSTTGKKKGCTDTYDDEEENADMKLVGEAPYPPLPPVEIVLKKRDSTSIEIAWDVSAQSMAMLMAVRQAYGKNKQPLYQVQYRQHTSATAAAASTAAASGDSTKSNIANSKKEKELEDQWKLGITRTSDFGGIITGLQAYTSYQIRCRRIGWCENGWSKTVPVVIRSGPGVPSAPLAVNAREVSSESILISWNVPSKDNGLPILEYIVTMKPYGKNSTFMQVYKGKERCHLCTNLNSNAVHVFEIQAINKVGKSPWSERFAVRTLPPGAAALSPWVEMIDERSHKLFYCHSKTSAIAWKLPSGAIVDEVGSFKNKRSYLNNQMTKRMASLCTPYNVLHRPLQIQIDRSNLLERSLRILHHTPAEEINQGPIRVHFTGEDGMDAGGLAKDWYIEVSKRLFDDSTGLLTVNEDTRYITIDQRASSIHSIPESIRLFKAIGTFFAKAIIDGQTLGINLDPLLLCLMSGRVPTLDTPQNTHNTARVGFGIDTGKEEDGDDDRNQDAKNSFNSSHSSNCGTDQYVADEDIGVINGMSVLQLTEPQFYKGLKWVEANNVTHADLTFTCSYELFDESHTVELVPYGNNRPVTQDNKHEYIRLMTQWLLKDRYEPAISSLMEGFTNHINVARYMKIFSLTELQQLLGGVAHIDPKELSKNALFGGFVSQSDAVLYLFQLLEELPHEKLSKFLSFVSGCPCVPIDGLKPPLLVTLMEEGTDESLPKAHTCFNQIVIPKYSSYDVLKDRVLYALENASEGFFIS